MPWSGCHHVTESHSLNVRPCHGAKATTLLAEQETTAAQILKAGTDLSDAVTVCAKSFPRSRLSTLVNCLSRYCGGQANVRGDTPGCQV